MPLASLCVAEMAQIPSISLHLIVSESAEAVLAAEGSPGFPPHIPRYGNSSLDAPCASGSWQASAMIICPCSANTLAATACGLAGNLVQRAALVTLKERRPLILCLRETPFSLPMIKAMTQAAEAGAIIMPFIPAFYGAKNMAGAMRQFCGHLLDLLKIENDLRKRWPECAATGKTGR